MSNEQWQERKAQKRKGRAVSYFCCLKVLRVTAIRGCYAMEGGRGKWLLNAIGQKLHIDIKILKKDDFTCI